MALTKSPKATLGVIAPDFCLPATDGKTYKLADFDDKAALVVLFVCNHCPYVKATLGRFSALQHHFSSQSVQFVGINPNDAERYPEDSFENMKALAKEKKLPFPYLRDETQDVAKAYGAVCTPDVFVYDRERKLRYRGQLDDNWKEPANVTREDLKKAIECVVKDQPIPFNPVPPMGCSIKWKQ